MEVLADMTQNLHALFNNKAGLIKIARKTGFIKRLRKVNPLDFLRSCMVTLMLEKTASLRDYTFSFHCNSRLKLSKSGLRKRFNSQCVLFLEQVTKHLCSTIFSRSFGFTELADVTSVLVVDSSQLALSDKLMIEFPGMRNVKSLLKLQTTIDCLQGSPKGLELTPANGSDQSYKGHLDYINPGTLVMNDLGYFSCETLRQVMDKGGHFLTRYHRSATLYDKKGHEISLNDLLTGREDCLIDMQVFVGKKHRLPCRFIATRLTDEAYQKRLRGLRKKRKRDPRIPTYLSKELDKWSILLTSLSQDQLSPEKAWAVYACRWQVELLFKLLKSELHLGEFTHQNINRTKAEIYLKYIGLCLIMMMTIAITEKEISLIKAVSIFKRFCGSLFGASYRTIYRGLSNLIFYFRNYAGKERRDKRPSSRECLGWEAIS